MTSEDNALNEIQEAENRAEELRQSGKKAATDIENKAIKQAAESLSLLKQEIKEKRVEALSAQKVELRVLYKKIIAEGAKEAAKIKSISDAKLAEASKFVISLLSA
ncbi:MAG: hypothetical protein Q8P52_03465 [bacterium]|nr:hypothetical protein [bacterium]